MPIKKSRRKRRSAYKGGILLFDTPFSLKQWEKTQKLFPDNSVERTDSPHFDKTSCNNTVSKKVL